MTATARPDLPPFTPARHINDTLRIGSQAINREIQAIQSIALNPIAPWYMDKLVKLKVEAAATTESLILICSSLRADMDMTTKEITQSIRQVTNNTTRLADEQNWLSDRIVQH